MADFIEGFAARVAGAGAHRHRRSPRCGVPTTATRSTTDQGEIRAPGGRDRQRRLQPADACRRSPRRVPASVQQVTPFDYRSPDQLPEGGVLVVGASATGVQLAAELQRSGRPVTLSVGEHVRLPRTYRGRDVLWWMDASGVWDQRYDEVDDLTRARRLPSPQLVGTPERATLDLNALTDAGRRAGRPLGRGPRRRRAVLRRPAQRLRARRPQAAAAARQLRRAGPLATGRRRRARPAERLEPTRVPATSRLQLDLRSGEIGTVVWATGYRPDYSWLDVPVVDDKGQLRHDGGVRRQPRALRARACRCCAAASRPSSTASRTTPARSSTTSRATWPSPVGRGHPPETRPTSRPAYVPGVRQGARNSAREPQ